MPTCLVCGKHFASQKTLSNHRKRLHSDSMEKKDLAKSIIDKIEEKPFKFQKINSKPMQDSEKPKRKFQDKNSKPMQVSDSSSEEIPCGSKRKFQEKNTIAKPMQDSDSNSEEVPYAKLAITFDSGSEADSESEPEPQRDLVKYPETKKGDDRLLTDSFIALYEKFDEDDLEAYYTLREFLEALKARGCMDEFEYNRIKSHLEEKMKANLQQTIDAAVENMTHEDKRAVLKLVGKLKKSSVTKRLIGLVKDYYAEEAELNDVLQLGDKLKDKVNASRLRIILKQIDKTKQRVNKIFSRIMSGVNLKDTLDDLRLMKDISSDEYEKLIISPKKKLSNFSKIIQGRGITF